MSRSGTSAVAGLFRLAGYYAGDDDELMPADAANEAGYSENLAILELNERILDALEGSWFDPPSEECLETERERFALDVGRAYQLILEHSDGAPVALKDPRIPVMMPVWWPVIGAQLQPVLVVRDPLEVSASLEHRDGTARPIGLAAWEINVTRVLRWLNGCDVVAAPYGRMLESPDCAGSVVEAATKCLSPERAARTAAVDSSEWLSPDLRHNQPGAGEYADLLTERQHELWRWLAGLEAGLVTLRPPDHLQFPSEAALAAVKHETLRYQRARELTDASRWLSEAAEVRDQLIDAHRDAEERAHAAGARAGAAEAQVGAAQARAVVAEAVAARAAEASASHRDVSRARLRGLRSLKKAAERVASRLDTKLDVGAIFPAIEAELGPYSHLFTGNVLNAGAGNRDISSLVSGKLYNQDIAEGLHSEGIDFVSPLHAIPTEAGFFNTIICNAVLEHVSNPEEVMAEFHRVSAPGATLYLTVPFMQPEHRDPTDFQRYTIDGLSLLCTRHGFDVHTAEGIHSVFTTLAWILREWLESVPGVKGAAARAVIYRWLMAQISAGNPKYVASLASAHRVIATRMA
jgi:SAM-dependent methyltransferase